MLTISGFQKDISYQQCTRCICDNTIPGISFDSKGVCSLCDIHDRFDATFPNDERGAAALDAKFAKSKKEEQKIRIPAVVHADGSCRIQTVSQEDNPLFFQLITDFKKQSEVGLLLNTSFNLNHEPIVNTPREAIASFFASGIDVLYLGDYRIQKNTL